MALQFKQNGITHTVRPRHEALAKPDVHDPYAFIDGPKLTPCGFTRDELSEILSCADCGPYGKPRLYRIQEIMGPKQTLSKEILALHGKVFDHMRYVNVSVWADAVADVAAEVLEWARRELLAVGGGF